MVDGVASTANLDAPSPALQKVARLQRAFAQLQWADDELLEAHLPALFQWGHLIVMQQIGCGGFGEVFRAFDPMLQRNVALKLRRADSQFAPASGRAFIEEARRLARVRHPNVLAVHGAAVHEGRAGIWTDLIVGETLAARVAREGPMTAEQLLVLLSGLSAALVAVHAQAIVHGDLTPNNVMCEAVSGRFLLMDFGGGASLDESGQARLLAGSAHFMAPEQLGGDRLGTAADLYSLGATACYAANRKLPVALSPLAEASLRKDLGKPLRMLISQLLQAQPTLRPTSEWVQERCHELLTAPERARRGRLRQALVAMLIVTVVATTAGMILTLRSRAETELERNRVATTRDFLLGLLRVPNPTQSVKPTRQLDDLFEQAVATLPKAFGDDPKTEAMLLNQFGRSLLVMDRDESAIQALIRADQLLTKADVRLEDEGRIDTRAYLDAAHRMRRDFPAAIALANEQARLCDEPNSLPARTCLFIVSDQIQSIGYGGDPARALLLAEENIARANANGLEGDSRAVYSYYLRGLMQRELGQTKAAAESFIDATNQSLVVLPASHPGLIIVLTWLTWSADDLGDLALASELNAYALTTFSELYGISSHYTLPLRFQQVILAQQAGDEAQARLLLDGLRGFPQTATFSSYSEQATVLAALVGDLTISNADLEQAERSRLSAVGETSPALAKLRLDLVAVALKRGNPEQASILLERIRPIAESDRYRVLQPMYWQLRRNLALAMPVVDASLVAAATARVLAGLQQQQRKLFDPVTESWVGAPVDDSAGASARIRQAAEAIIARRATLTQSHP